MSNSKMEKLAAKSVKSMEVQDTVIHGDSITSFQILYDDWNITVKSYILYKCNPVFILICLFI